jgi:uncharacterized protein (TIGR03118 family)
MKKITPSKARFIYRNGRLLLFFFLVSSMGCKRFLINLEDNKKVGENFSQVNLVADNASFGATHMDPLLQNAWGLAWAPSGIAWVNSQAGHVSALYDQNGVALRAPIRIPSPVDTIGGNPTGIVFNNVTGFTLPDGKAANFIFVGVDGVISAWNGPTGNNAVRIGTGEAKSSYTGLALAASGGQNFLYAANFGLGRIDVWDTGWHAITKMHFHDPNMRPGFAPFNIRAIGSWLYVAYAKVGADGRDQAGPGLGFVDIFNTDGTMVKRFTSGGSLNAPWGMEMAASGFLDLNDEDGHGNNGDGNNSGHGNNNGNDHHDGNDNDNQAVILVGNFGDGHISVFTVDGNFLGQMQSHNHTLVIDGLWALSFPPSTSTIDPTRLYFTAGPNGETDGLFGYLIRQ